MRCPVCQLAPTPEERRTGVCDNCGRSLSPEDEAVQATPPDRDEGRPRRRRARRLPEATSGKATASVLLGVASCFFSLLTAIPGVIVGILSLIDISKSNGRLGGKGVAVTGIVLNVFNIVVLGPAVLFSTMRVREAAARMSETNTLKQIGLAMHNYHDTNGAFPPQAVYSRDGKPMHSWRVLILPYLEQDSLFLTYNMNQPWDGPANQHLQTTTPKIYQTPGRPAPPGMTYFQVFVGRGTAFERVRAARAGGPDGPVDFPGINSGIRIVDITDGTSTTILVALGKDPVPWTKPQDLPFDPNGPLPELSDHFRVYQFALADGSVRSIIRTGSEGRLRALITRNGGDQAEDGP